MQVVLLISIIASIVFLTVYGGGIYTWSVLLVAVCLAGATCFAMHKKGSATSKSSVGRGSFYPVVFMAIVGFILLTLMPLPTPLTVITGSTRYEQNCVVAELIHKSEELKICKPVHPFFSTTRNRAGTLRALLLLAAIYGAFEITRLLSARTRIIYLHIIVFMGVVIAVAGYLSYTIFPQGDTLWWFIPVQSAFSYSVGGFLNINHYAGFTAMLAVAAFGLAGFNLFSKKWILAGFTSMAALLMTGFVANATSRGAMLALGSGLFTLVFMILLHMKGRIRLISIFVIATAIVIGVAVGLQNPDVRQRVVSLRHPYSDPGGNPRLNAWAGAVRLWKSYPVVGVGANAFKFGYLQHKDKLYRPYRRFAENEVLQILSEGGIVGLGLSLLLLFFILGVLFRNIKNTKGDDNSIVAICAVAVLSTAIAHSMVDFILHLPLYTITLATLVGTGMPRLSWRFNRLNRIAITVTLLLAVALVPMCKIITQYDRPGFLTSASNDQLIKSLIWAPINTPAWRRLGANIKQIGIPETNLLAESILEQVAQYDPTNFQVWINLGKAKLELNDRCGAKKSFEKATEIRSWAPVPKIEN